MVLSLSGTIRPREDILNEDVNENQSLACQILKHILKLWYLKLWEIAPILFLRKREDIV